MSILTWMAKVAQYVDPAKFEVQCSKALRRTEGMVTRPRCVPFRVIASQNDYSFGNHRFETNTAYLH